VGLVRLRFWIRYLENELVIIRINIELDLNLFLNDSIRYHNKTFKSTGL
jgi:hypothetical protein